MKSLRLPLFIFFLLVAAGAVGFVAWFGYENVREGLESRKKTGADVYALDYAESCRRETANFDRHLVARARALVSQLDRRVTWVRNQVEPLCFALGLINSNFQHQGHLQVSLWVAEFANAGLARRLRTPEYHLEATEPAEPLLEADEYYQLNSSFLLRPLARSENLDFWLPADEDLRKKANWQGYLDSMTSSDGKPLRRVSMSWLNIGHTRDGFIVPSGRPPVLPKGTAGTIGRPSVLFQYARETTARDEKLAKLKTNLERDTAELHDAIDKELSGLRNNLFVIGGGAFLVLACAGFLLVRAGPVGAPGNAR